MMTTFSDPPTMPTTATATNTKGMLRRRVMIKVITMSTRPPKYPATTPKAVPMTPEMRATQKPMRSEICAP